MAANIKQFRQTILIIGSVILGLWVISWLQHLALLPDRCWGIRPRQASGLVGVLTAPFFHGGLGHLAANSAPLAVLSAAVWAFYRPIAWRVMLYIYLASGLWVWVAARDGCHIGASGVIYGLAFFLFFSGIFRKDRAALALSLIVSFLYGSIVWGMLPGDPGTSWEGHLFGGLAGLITAYLLRKEAPRQQTAYSWEHEPESEEEEEDYGIWNYRKLFPPPKGMKHPDD